MLWKDLEMRADGRRLRTGKESVSTAVHASLSTSLRCERYHDLLKQGKTVLYLHRPGLLVNGFQPI